MAKNGDVKHSNVFPHASEGENHMLFRDLSRAPSTQLPKPGYTHIQIPHPEHKMQKAHRAEREGSSKDSVEKVQNTSSACIAAVAGGVWVRVRGERPK